MTEEGQRGEMKSIAGSTRRSLAWLLTIFVLFTSVLVATVMNLPDMPEEHRAITRSLPRNMEQAKQLATVLSQYRQDHYYSQLSCVALVYIFLQTFAIPGSIFLSVVCGFLFNFYVALFLVCCCSAIGASLCYLSWGMVGPPLLYKYMKERVDSWRSTVNRHRDHILNYIIFLRITPFVPNWFINISSPVLDIPLVPFFVGTFIGVAPPSFVAISAGQNIYQLTTAGDTISFKSVIMLAVFAIISILPVIFKNKLKSHFD